MNKKELILMEILDKTIENKQYSFTQKEIAEKLGVSLSTVFNALKIPRQSGAIRVTGRNFTLEDTEKLLYIWATGRDLEKEIVYRAYVPAGAAEIEGLMPAGAVFSAYSAYAQKYGEAPADYDKVYVRADSVTLEEIKKRFPAKKGEPNLFVLKMDGGERSKNKGMASDALIFSDLWNLRDWYAKDFLNKLKEKILFL